MIEEIEEMKNMDRVQVLLDRWQGGDSEAMEELLPLAYQELRRLASGYLREEEDDHTMATLDLVHESFIRLTSHRCPTVMSRNHFVALLARTMRQLLVEHARKQSAGKRIGRGDRVNLDQMPELGVGSGLEVIEIHEAIEALNELHPRQAAVVELRFFGGLKNSECAKALDMSKATVTRDWQIARIWLRRWLRSDGVELCARQVRATASRQGRTSPQAGSSSARTQVARNPTHRNALDGVDAPNEASPAPR